MHFRPNKPHASAKLGERPRDSRPSAPKDRRSNSAHSSASAPTGTNLTVGSDDNRHQLASQSGKRVDLFESPEHGGIWRGTGRRRNRTRCRSRCAQPQGNTNTRRMNVPSQWRSADPAAQDTPSASTDAPTANTGTSPNASRHDAARPEQCDCLTGNGNAADGHHPGWSCLILNCTITR